MCIPQVLVYTVPVVFLAQVQAVLLHGVVGGGLHWLLLHLNQIEPACRDMPPVP